MDFHLEDFISGWEGVQESEDHQWRLATPPPPAPVEQSLPSTDDLLDFEDILGTFESEVIKTPEETTAKEITPPVSPPAQGEQSLPSIDDLLKFEDFLETLEWDVLETTQETTVKEITPPVCSNIQDLHTCTAPPIFATDNAASRRRKPDDTEDKPYIKKPPDAFMLFRAEQRQNVADELHITNSAKVSVVLGERWKMMSEQEQAPYFEQARRERWAHETKYPGWSPKDNFGKKSKRRRKSDQILVPPNHHHFAFSVAPTNPQPVMTWPYATAPMSFPNQALNNQVYSYHTYHSENDQKPFQELPMETITINGIPVQATRLEDFLNQARENQEPMEVFPTETFTTSVSPFQDLSNQTPDDLARTNRRLSRNFP